MKFSVNIWFAIIVWLILFMTCSVTGKPSFSKIDFNNDWFFVKNQAEWAVDFKTDEALMQPVILPHTWNAGLDWLEPLRRDHPTGLDACPRTCLPCLCRSGNKDPSCSPRFGSNCSKDAHGGNKVRRI